MLLERGLLPLKTHKILRRDTVPLCDPMFKQPPPSDLRSRNINKHRAFGKLCAAFCLRKGPFIIDQRPRRCQFFFPSALTGFLPCMLFTANQNVRKDQIVIADRLFVMICCDLLVSGKQCKKPFFITAVQAVIERFLQRAALHIVKLHAMLCGLTGIDQKTAPLIFPAQFLIA